MALRVTINFWDNGDCKMTYRGETAEEAFAYAYDEHESEILETLAQPADMSTANWMERAVREWWSFEGAEIEIVEDELSHYIVPGYVTPPSDIIVILSKPGELLVVPRTSVFDLMMKDYEKAVDFHWNGKEWEQK